MTVIKIKKIGASYVRVISEWFCFSGNFFMLEESQDSDVREAKKFFWYSMNQLYGIPTDVLAKVFKYSQTTIMEDIYDISERRDKDSIKLIKTLYDLNLYNSKADIKFL